MWLCQIPLFRGGRLWLPKALQGDRRDEISHPEHLICESFVDERSVGKAEKYAVGMLFAKADQIILADKGLTAGIDVHVNA